MKIYLFQGTTYDETLKRIAIFGESNGNPIATYQMSDAGYTLRVYLYESDGAALKEVMPCDAS